MQNDSIQMRTAVQMFIDFLLEHREELEQQIEERHRQEARQILAEIQGKQTESAAEPTGDSNEI